MLSCAIDAIYLFLMKGSQLFTHPATPIAELTTLTHAEPITLAQMS